MKSASFLLCALGLAACAPLTSEKAAPSSAWTSATVAAMDNLGEKALVAVSSHPIPVLRSAKLAKAWGEPTFESAPDGTYRLSYANHAAAFERLVIYGYPRPLPHLTEAPDFYSNEMVNDELTAVAHSQQFREVSILGKPVRWFTETTGGGADGNYYTTEGFTLIDPAGKIGHYRLVIESISGAAPARFQAVSW
ncbi:MAG: hypothetical protein Q7Q71_13080 [Verrucomicrobiota bacterium JB023]|nr:hypothetical protein [Verrucomicrobiota bacterium JB023]